MVPDNNGIVHIINTPTKMTVKATLIISNAAGLTINTVLQAVKKNICYI